MSKNRGSYSEKVKMSLDRGLGSIVPGRDRRETAVPRPVRWLHEGPGGSELRAQGAVRPRLVLKDRYLFPEEPEASSI